MADIKNNIHTTNDIPVWRKFLLTIKEAATYSGVGENKIRSIIKYDNQCNFCIKNGNKTLIVRQKFEDYLLNKSEL